MIKHMDTEKMPELADEGQKKKRKDQNIRDIQVHCLWQYFPQKLSVKTALPICLLSVEKNLLTVFP